MSAEPNNSANTWTVQVWDGQRMTAIQRDEAFDRLEDACCAEHEACQEQRRLVAQAQGIAAGLEAELAAVLLALRTYFSYRTFAPAGDPFIVDRAMGVLREYAAEGTLSAESLSLVASLEADSGTEATPCSRRAARRP